MCKRDERSCRSRSGNLLSTWRTNTEYSERRNRCDWIVILKKGAESMPIRVFCDHGFVGGQSLRRQRVLEMKKTAPKVRTNNSGLPDPPTARSWTEAPVFRRALLWRIELSLRQVLSERDSIWQGNCDAHHIRANDDRYLMRLSAATTTEL